MLKGAVPCYVLMLTLILKVARPNLYATAPSKSSGYSSITTGANSATVGA